MKKIIKHDVDAPRWVHNHEQFVCINFFIQNFKQMIVPY